MAGRRFLLAVVLLAAVLHGISIARSLLPAQDGLKFIRIARQFQNDPWPDVVRGTDQPDSAGLCRLNLGRGMSLEQRCHRGPRLGAASLPLRRHHANNL